MLLLSVVMREWKEKGNEIPSDLFSVLDADKAKIKKKVKPINQ